MKLDVNRSGQFDKKYKLTDYKDKHITINNTNISFKGLNVSRFSKKIIRNNDRELSQKFERFVEESVDLLKELFIKITKKDKMPFNSKPLIAPEDMDYLEALANAGNNKAKSTLEVAEQLLNKGIIDRNSDVFTIDGKLKSDEVGRSIVLRAQAYATDNYHISNRMDPKSAKELIDGIIAHNGGRNSLLMDQASYLDDIANNKLSTTSVDFMYPPGERTSVRYILLKHNEEEMDRLRDRAINGKTTKNMTIKELNEDLAKFEEEKRLILLDRPDLVTWETEYLREHPEVAREIIEKHPEYKSVILQKNPDLFPKTIGESISETLDEITNIKNDVKENLIEIKDSFAQKLGLNQADTLSLNLEADKLAPSLNDIKFGANHLSDVETSNNGATILSGLSNVAEKTDIISDVLDKTSDVIEKISEIPGIDEATGGLALVLKFKGPIQDALKGDYEKAGVKTITRAIDTALIPVKWVKASLGGVKGIILKAKHIKSESTGFWRGVNNDFKKWTRARNNIEDEFLGVEKLTPQERFERIQAEKQKVIDQMRETIQSQAHGQDDAITQFKNAEVGKINSKIEQAENTTRIEKKKIAFYQKQTAEAQALVANDIETAKSKLNNLLVECEQLKQSHKESLNEIAIKIEIARKESNKTLQEQLEKQLQKAEANYNLKLHNINANITKVTQLVEVYEKLANKSKLKGLSRIAGYNEQKSVLLTNFAELIKREKAGENVNIPNALLLYGPKGNGKTTLTAALADHLDCNIVKIENTLIHDQDLSNLKNAAEKAKEKFLKDGTRTIISIDEFDYFADKSNPLNSKLETFINNISKDYYCTIFATTNNPQDIGQQILKGNLFHKIAFGPANKENTAEILKYYIEDFAYPSVNYDKLAKLIIDRSQSEAYSNSRLAGILTDLVTNEKNLGKRLSQKDLQDAITNTVPDIGEENLKLFNEQVQYCNKLTADNSSHLYKPTKVTRQSQPGARQISEATKPATIDEQANQAYTQYAHKLATESKLENKEALIKEVLPDLMTLKNNDDALKAVLEYITPQNKDFIVKKAVPAILRNSETLDLGKAMETALKSVSPETVDCLDKLAANVERFKIKSQVDSINLLKSLTKENKDFAIEELFPYLAENIDKYKIRQSGIMAKFLDVVTPQNKDFMLNEAIPAILNNKEALNIDIIDALKISKHLNQNNLKNVQTITENIEKLDLKDADGFLDINKFVRILSNEKNVKPVAIDSPITIQRTPKSPKVSTIDEQANQAYTQYAHKLATESKLENKEALIKEVLPDLMILKNNDDALKEVLEHITPQNKDFVVKTAVPAILRNSETLDLGKAMGTALKSVSPETVDCLDKLASNVERFKIKSQTDSLNLLKSVTAKNKDFAFNELFPHLADNADKYKITRGGYMAKFLDVVTPQNKDFMLNEAIPAILNNKEALNIDITDALKITKHLNKDNFKNIQLIIDNINKLSLKDSDGFLDIDKFVMQLEK